MVTFKLIYLGCYQIRSFYNEGPSLCSVSVAVLDAVQMTLKEQLNFIGFPPESTVKDSSWIRTFRGGFRKSCALVNEHMDETAAIKSLQATG